MLSLIKRILPGPILDFYHLTLAYLANWFYGFPSKELVVIGVTGTNGKSTTVNLIARILEAAGESLTLSPCASIKDAAHTPCKQFSNCSAGRFWNNLESEVRKYASDKSLADLIAL